MLRFPFPYYPYNYNYHKFNQSNYSTLNPTQKNTIDKNPPPSSNITYTKKEKYTKNTEENIFSIFGINLYIDDLIILSLLFFLYKENVKDELLYIILFLLLIS